MKDSKSEYLKECIRILNPTRDGEKILLELEQDGKLRDVPMKDLEVLVDKPNTEDRAAYLRWRRRAKKYGVSTAAKGVSLDKKKYRRMYYLKTEGATSAPNKMIAIQQHIDAMEEHLAAVKLLLDS